MVATPWGDSETLRDRRLRPGGAHPRAEAAQNQRARIYGAVVASTAERGYAATRLEDLVEISGVSMRSFYELFPDKEAAFVATLELLLGATVDRVLVDPRSDDWEAGMTERLRALGELFDLQSPAARMCVLEAYAAGPRAVELLEQTIVRAENLVRDRLADSPERAAMPPEMAVAAVGAVIEVLRAHLLHKGRSIAGLVPPLLSFLLDFRPPANRLRSAARAPEVRPEAAEASDHAERALRAFEALLAEGRYAEVTMDQVAERARMSRRTLYANFSDRERLLAAAIDSACAQVIAVALPAYNRHDVSAEGLRAAIGALLAFLASRPNLANLLLVSVYEGGEPALRRRARGLRPLRQLLQQLAAAPNRAGMTWVGIEATLGGLLALLRRRLLESGSGSLVGLGPICTYMVMAPLIGTEQATIAAEGRAYRRGRPDVYTGVVKVEKLVEAGSLWLGFGHGQARSVAEVAEEAGVSRDVAAARVADLVEAGALEPVDEPAGDGPRYVARWPLIATDDWGQVEQQRREAMSTEIGRIIQLEVEDAFVAGTFDSRPERHLVRLPVLLDEQGWRELSERLDATLDECLEIEARARARLKALGEAGEGISTRIYLASFEAPPGTED